MQHLHRIYTLSKMNKYHCQYLIIWCNFLLNIMAGIHKRLFSKTFLNECLNISITKMAERYHQESNSQNCYLSGNGLALSSRQAITRSNDGPVYWYTHALLALKELTNIYLRFPWLGYFALVVELFVKWDFASGANTSHYPNGKKKKKKKKQPIA